MFSNMAFVGPVCNLCVIISTLQGEKLPWYLNLLAAAMILILVCAYGWWRRNWWK